MYVYDINHHGGGRSVRLSLDWCDSTLEVEDLLIELHSRYTLAECEANILNDYGMMMLFNGGRGKLHELFSLILFLHICAKKKKKSRPY